MKRTAGIKGDAYGWQMPKVMRITDGMRMRREWWKLGVLCMRSVHGYVKWKGM